MEYNGRTAARWRWCTVSVNKVVLLAGWPIYRVFRARLLYDCEVDYVDIQYISIKLMMLQY
jgi:hypothetical protein